MAVDDLFDGPGAGVRPDARVSLRRWLAVAGVLVVAGPFCCFTGPFGAFVAIWVWVRAGDEIVRAEAGVVPAEAGEAARSARRAAFGLMATSLLSLLLQGIFYPVYSGAARWVAESLWPTLLELYMQLTAPA